MVKKILVPLDGSPTSEAVFPHIRALLKRTDADLILFHACTKSAAEQGVGREYLDRLIVRLEDQFPVLRSELVVGNAVDKIIEAAILERVDLIAMTTHGRTGLSKLLYGSVAEKLLAKCPVPMLLVRPDTKVCEYRRLLVPLDGSARAKSVIPIAVDLGSAADAEIVLLTAATDRMPAHLEAAAKTLGGHGVRVKTLVAAEDPAKAILEAVERNTIDLVVIATHGRTGANRARFGSVTTDILKGLRIPVLVKRTGGALEHIPKIRKSRTPEPVLPRKPPMKYV